MKKYDIIYCLLFLIAFFCLAIPHVSANLPLSGKIIYLDPGHGGVDPGSVVGSIYEKDINLAISLYLKDELIKRGASVLLTRDGDYDLGSPNATYRKKSDFDGRIHKINESKADYYISIHLNVLPNKNYSGAQVFYNKKDAKNEKLANTMQLFLNEKLHGKREVAKIPTSTYMYSKLKIPGILIECGFLSNYQEREKLLTESYQKELATYIAEALSKNA